MPNRNLSADVRAEIKMIEEMTDNELIDQALYAGRYSAEIGHAHGHYNHGIDEVTEAWLTRYDKLIDHRKKSQPTTVQSTTVQYMGQDLRGY